jgi:hypothetical protein
MSFNYKLMATVKKATANLNIKLASLLNVKTSADLFPSLPGKPIQMHPAIPGKATGPASPFPSSKKIHMPSPEHAQKMQSLNIPKGFENDPDALYASNAANYYFPEEGYPAGQARQYNHQNISNNIQDQQAYNLNARNMANAAFNNRMGTPWTVTYNPTKGSYGEVNSDLSKVRNVNIGSDVQNNVSWTSMPSWSPGVIASHEVEHAGTQIPKYELSKNPIGKIFGKVVSESDQNPDAATYRYETPAVLAELAAGSQAAYLANNNKPLTGHMTIDPRMEFKVPLETFRKEVERRGHVGGAHNVSMTEMLNSPEGQEFLRMNLQRERIRRMREQGQ